jgi:hypothetical protein
MQIWTPFISTEKFGYTMANFKLYLAYDALEDLATLPPTNLTLGVKEKQNCKRHYSRFLININWE